MNKPRDRKDFSNVRGNDTLDRVSSIISSVLSSSKSKILIATTGSSGRNEDYSQLDELELLAYGAEGTEEELSTLGKILETAVSDGCDLGIEGKSFKSPEMYEGRGDITLTKPQFFPSRFVDHSQLYGSEEDYEELVGNFIENIAGKNSKQIGEWRSRISTHKKVSNSGEIKWKGVASRIYDDNERIINYSKVPGGQEISIKIGALRYIQYQIVQQIMVLIRATRLSTNGFGEIGQSVEQKLDFLGDQGLSINFIELQELKGLYSFFLGIHNSLSKRFQKNGTGILELSDSEYKDFKENLVDFNALMEKFKLKS